LSQNHLKWTSISERLHKLVRHCLSFIFIKAKMPSHKLHNTILFILKRDEFNAKNLFNKNYIMGFLDNLTLFCSVFVALGVFYSHFGLIQLCLFVRIWWNRLRLFGNNHIKRHDSDSPDLERHMGYSWLKFFLFEYRTSTPWTFNLFIKALTFWYVAFFLTSINQNIFSLFAIDQSHSSYKNKLL